MKFYFKNAIPSILMFGILCLCLTGCQKEDAPVKEEAIVSPKTQVLPTVNTIYGQQVDGNTFTSLKDQYGLNSLLSNSTESSSELSKTSTTNKEIIIHDDVIKEITLGDYTSYTMRLTLANGNSSAIYNLTVEDNNGETGMFVTTYTPSQNSPMGKSVNNNEMSISTQRITNIDTYNPNEDNVTENGLGGTGGSGGGSSSQTYPQDCDGFVIGTTVLLPYQCGCNPHHWPWESCDCGTKPGYEYITTYECSESYNYNDTETDNNNNPSGGGGTSGGSGSPSYTTPIGVDGSRVAENFIISELNIVDTKTINWIFNGNNALKVLSVYNFLRSDNSAEAKKFAKLVIEILMANPNANPLIGADCRSFEYAHPPGALQRGCAVRNFNHTFYSRPQLLPNGGFRVPIVDSNISVAYFTAPVGMTNGRAANLTAIAVTAAIKATDLYFAANPNASKETVGQFFKNSINTTMRVWGGSINTTTPPFAIPSPAPYITSVLGISNPIDCE